MDVLNLLIFESDAASARALTKIASELGKVRIARTVAEAEALLRNGLEWAAMVIDLRLPDGYGIDFLPRARRAHPQATAVLYTGFIEDELEPQGVRKNVYGIDQVRLLLLNVLAARLGEPDPVLTAGRAWCARFHLPDGEADVFIKHAQGLTQGEIAKARRSTPRTIRSQEQSICRKTGEEWIEEAVARFFREALRESWRRRRPEQM
jgi:DNA-binding NarL/FixJ family response regulator